MAKTEAVIDFGEDENIEEGVMDEGKQKKHGLNVQLNVISY